MLNINTTVNSANEALKTLVSSNLAVINAKVNNINNKERIKVNYLPIDDCQSLLLSFGRDLARELLGPIYEYLQNETEKREQLEAKVVYLETELDKTNKELMETKIDNDKANQFGRREMIRLHNIPEPTLPKGQHEDVHKTVITVLKDANIDIEEHMISSAQRLPVKRENGKDVKTKPITFKLTRRYDRNRILRLKKIQMKDNAEFQQLHKNAFMTEDLTPLRQHMAYKLRTDENIAVSWSIDGRLKCLKKGYKEGDKPIIIDTPHDLGKIGYSSEEIHAIIKQSLYNKIKT